MYSQSLLHFSSNWSPFLSVYAVLAHREQRKESRLIP